MGFYLLCLLELLPNPQLQRHLKQQLSRTKCFVVSSKYRIIYLTTKLLVILRNNCMVSQHCLGCQETFFPHIKILQLILHCCGCRKSDRCKHHCQTGINCTTPTTMAVHRGLSVEGAAFQKVPENTPASELATADGDVSQGSLGRAVFLPLWYIHTTL